MAILTLTHKMHAALARFRRRTWTVVGLCFAVQIGNVALHANEHAFEDGNTSASTAAAPTPASGQPDNHSKNHNQNLGSK
jgi:hypothetical protein